MKIYNATEIAQLKHVTRDAIYKARRRGLLPSLRTANGNETTVFGEGQVRRYLARRSSKGGEGAPCEDTA